MDPLVSVLVPTLNVSDYVDRSIPAILDQTLSDIEILILDGGSTDGTLEYCENIRDKRLHLCRDCGNIVDSLNKGIDISRGKYIARADADTIPEPNWLEKSINFLEKNPEYGAVGAQVRRIDSGRILNVTDKPQHHEEIIEDMLWRNPMIHPTMVIRKESLIDIDGYRDRHWEDYDLVVRLAKNNYLYNFEEVLVDDYFRDESIVASTAANKSLIASLKCSWLAFSTTSHSIPTKVQLGIKSLKTNISGYIYTLYKNRK